MYQTTSHVTYLHHMLHVTYYKYICNSLIQYRVFSLCIVTPPIIKSHPVDIINIVSRRSCTFSISVDEIPGVKYRYQWQKNGSNLPGATSSSYIIQGVMNADEGSYTCVVSNAVGKVCSESAQLTLCEFGSNKHTLSHIDNFCFSLANSPHSLSLSLYAVSPPIINTHPVDILNIGSGRSGTFTISVDEIPGVNYTYQWQKNGSDLPGATSSSHFIQRVVNADEGSYTCAVNNAAGEVSSESAQLTLCELGDTIHALDQSYRSV